MLANRSRDTSPELALLRALRRRGLRPKTHVRLDVPQGHVTTDMVLTRSRVAIFVDGCFWHACPRHATWPTRNGQWWRAKLLANVARDIRQRQALRRTGWSVLRFWGHDDPNVAAQRVGRAVARRGSRG